MYTARQALEAALNASAAQLDRQTLINIVVEPGTDQYRVVLTLLAPSTQTTAPALVVQVDADTGQPSAPGTTQRPNPLLDLDAELRHSPFLNGLQAYQAALLAIKGYEHYDAYGRLEIRLTKDRYEVTFPDPAARLTGGHTADYTYLVWLNARTGAVLKILAAS